MGEIVAKHKKVWQGVDYRFARDDEPLPTRRADPNELIGYCDVRTLGDSRDHPGALWYSEPCSELVPTT